MDFWIFMNFLLIMQAISPSIGNQITSLGKFTDLYLWKLLDINRIVYVIYFIHLSKASQAIKQIYLIGVESYAGCTVNN